MYMAGYSLENVRDYEDLKVTVEGGVKEWHFVTHMLGALMIRVGIKEITEETAPELLYRIGQVEEIEGAFMGGPDGPRYVKATDIDRHMGMTATVAPKTNAKFEAEMARLRKEAAPRKRREVVREFERLRRTLA